MSALVLLAAVVAAPVPKSNLPPLPATNSNALVKQHKDALVIDSSTQYQGWEATKAFDGDEETSWFSADRDTASAGETPWLRVAFPKDVSVRRVSVRGNREPQWPGYTVTAGRIELLDAAGTVLAKEDVTVAVGGADLTFTPARPVAGVRAVRLVVTKDGGGHPNVAVGEMQVE